MEVVLLVRRLWRRWSRSVVSGATGMTALGLVSGRFLLGQVYFRLTPAAVFSALCTSLARLHPSGVLGSAAAAARWSFGRAGLLCPRPCLRLLRLRVPRRLATPRALTLHSPLTGVSHTRLQVGMIRGVSSRVCRSPRTSFVPSRYVLARRRSCARPRLYPCFRPRASPLRQV